MGTPSLSLSFLFLECFLSIVAGAALTLSPQAAQPATVRGIRCLITTLPLKVHGNSLGWWWSILSRGGQGRKGSLETCVVESCLVWD